MDSPYIFILDLDQTIIGDCYYPVTRYTLFESMKKQGKKTPPLYKTAIPHSYSKNSFLIRPGFANFIKEMQSHYKSVEFYIYTASMKNWALHEINWIEKALNIKFNRPIFTREDCIYDSNSYKKSLNKIMPRIWRSLKKYTLTKEDRIHIMHNQVMIIDNSNVYVDFKEKLLLCPNYNYIAFEDILDGLTNISESMLLSFVNQGLVCPSLLKKDGDTDIVQAMATRYNWMANKCTSIATGNEIYKKDQFWRRLRKLITTYKIKTFSSEIIKKLQAAVWTNISV